MLRRMIFTSVLLLAVMVTGGAALWQTRALSERDSIITELRKFLTEADQAAGVARLEKHTMEIDVRQARAALKELGEGESIESLRAELAAARQQLAAAETAMVETEDRLTEEIAAHAALKRKAEGLAEQLAVAGRVTEVSPVGATGALPDIQNGGRSVESTERAMPAVATPPPGKAAVKTSRPRRSAKPAFKAVKPGGLIFEPML
jgi:hypothetical protein